MADAAETAKTAGGVGSTIASALSMSNPYTAAAMGAGQLLSSVLPAIMSGHGREREIATANQESMQQWALDLQTAVQNGQMSPDTAIALIDEWLSSSTPGSQATAEDQRGYQEASRMLNQIKANMTEARQWQLNAPYEAGEALTGSSGFQKARGQTLLRNMLMGTESGNAFGNATGLSKLTSGPAIDVSSTYNKYMGQQPENPYLKQVQQYAGNSELSQQNQPAGGLGAKIQQSIDKFRRA